MLLGKHKQISFKEITYEHLHYLLGKQNVTTTGLDEV